MSKEVGRFVAATEDGKYETTIVLYADEVDVGTRGNPLAVGSRRVARTIEGFPCSYLKDGTFEVDHPLNHKLIVRML